MQLKPHVKPLECYCKCHNTCRCICVFNSCEMGPGASQLITIKHKIQIGKRNTMEARALPWQLKI